MNLSRRGLITAGATLAAASAISATAKAATTAGTPAACAEQAYWADQAALLDPRCYVYSGGTDWGIRVPDNETWYALNIWNAVAGDSLFPIYHRKADVANAFQMPPGFDLSASGTQSFVLYARPALVQADPRYSADPKGLYYTRLQTLACTPMQTISCHLPAGTPRPNCDGILGVCFPTGFSCGIIRHVSCHNGAWVTMVGPEGDGSTIINLLDEIDDGRGHRFTSSLMLPFDRSVWNGIWLEFGTMDRDKRSGDEYAGSLQTYDGFAHLAFQVLPEGW